MSKTLGIGVAVAVVFAIVAAIIVLRPRAAIEPVMLPTPAGASVSPALPGYADAAVQSCLQKSGASSAAIEAYCKCFATKSSELISAADAQYIEANKTLPPDFQAKVAPVMNACASENGLSIRR